MMYITYWLGRGMSGVDVFNSPWIYDEELRPRLSESVMIVPGTVSVDD